MDLPQKLDDFIKHSIDDSLGLPIPESSLQLKLQSLESSNHILRSQCLTLQSRLKEKEAAIDVARAEASKNAQSLKKFVEETQMLDIEFWSLWNKRRKLAGECVRRSDERATLAKAKSEAEERSKVALIRANELEEEVKQAGEDLQFYKHRCEMFPVGSSEEGTSSGQNLLNELITRLVSETVVAKTAQAFLEESSELEVCRGLLKMWNSLKPETQNILALAAQLQSLQKDNEQSRTNLQRAEEEVRVLFENNVLDEENPRLLKLYDSKGKHTSSGGSDSSDTTTKSKKRKTNPEMSSPAEKKRDIDDLGSPKHPLSPLKESNSPTSK